MIIINNNAACPLDAPDTLGCEAENPRKAAPLFCRIQAKDAWPLIRDFHYSRRMPGSPLAAFGIKLQNILVAAIIFSSPPTRWSEKVIELTRLVRCDMCPCPLSQLISYACRELKKQNYDLIVSFADWTQKHHGGIYQASGFSFHGQRPRANDGLYIDNIFIPGRTCNARWGTRSAEKLRSILGASVKIEKHFDEGKFLYWRALSHSGRKKAARLSLNSKSYPKPQKPTTNIHTNKTSEDTPEFKMLRTRASDLQKQIQSIDKQNIDPRNEDGTPNYFYESIDTTTLRQELNLLNQQIDKSSIEK